MPKITKLPEQFRYLTNAWVANAYLRAVLPSCSDDSSIYKKVAGAIRRMPYSWALHYLNNHSVRDLGVKIGKKRKTPNGRGVGPRSRLDIDKILEEATGIPRDKITVPSSGRLADISSLVVTCGRRNYPRRTN